MASESRIVVGGSPAGRHLIDDAHVQVAVDGQRQRPRDGGCRHDDHLGGQALFLEGAALQHTEPVLLVDYHQAQVIKEDVFRNKRVGAEEDGDAPIGNPGQDLVTTLPLYRGGEQGGANADGGQHPGEVSRVLLGKDFGGRHERGLCLFLHDGQRRGAGHHGLSRTRRRPG